MSINNLIKLIKIKRNRRFYKIELKKLKRKFIEVIENEQFFSADYLKKINGE